MKPSAFASQLFGLSYDQDRRDTKTSPPKEASYLGSESGPCFSAAAAEQRRNGCESASRSRTRRRSGSASASTRNGTLKLTGTRQRRWTSRRPQKTDSQTALPGPRRGGRRARPSSHSVNRRESFDKDFKKTVERNSNRREHT